MTNHKIDNISKKHIMLTCGIIGGSGRGCPWCCWSACGSYKGGTQIN